MRKNRTTTLTLSGIECSDAAIASALDEGAGRAVDVISQWSRLQEEESARQDTEAALRASEARLQEAQALARVGDWELDRDSGRMSWSRELFRLFERPESEGVPDINEALCYYSPESLEHTRDVFWHAIDSGERCTLEQELVLPSGKVRHHVTLIVPVADETGRVCKLYGTVQDITERKRLELERLAHLARVAELSEHLVDVQERERRQLAAALHDRASPNLAALQITFSNLASALPPAVFAEVEALLDDAHAILADTSAGIREICSELRPAALDYAGLSAAVQDYAEQVGRRGGIDVVLSVDQVDAHLSPTLQSLLFRIAQEAITNCAKHAAASMIRIELIDGGGDVTLRVSDDGIGFDPGRLRRRDSPHGLGLITMKERAEFAGGRFVLDSQRGRGTRIEVAFDIERGVP